MEGAVDGPAAANGATLRKAAQGDQGQARLGQGQAPETYGKTQQAEESGMIEKEKIMVEIQAAKQVAQTASAKLHKAKAATSKAYKQYLALKKEQTAAEKVHKQALGEVRNLLRQRQALEPTYARHGEHEMPAMHSRLFGHSVRSHEGHYYNRPR
jgi:hypothetical protein